LQAALAAANVEGAQIESINGTRADLSREGQPISPPLSLMFAMKKGTAKMLQGGQNRGWYVVHLQEVVKGDASGNKELLAARKQEITGLLQQEMGQQLIAAAAKAVGVEKNEDGIKELRARLTSRDAN
jgi:peptidyl-prolyl cis-trans isomerase D